MKNNSFFKPLFILIVILFGNTILFAQTNNEQLAIQYFKNQEYDKAVELFKDLYNNRPDAYYYNYYLQTLIELKDLKNAERLINKQIRIFPLIQKYKVDLGQIYELQEEQSKAKKQYDNCINQDNHNSVTIRELASAFLTYHLTDYAIKTYLQGRKISSTTTDYAIELAQLYAQKNEYQKAIDELFTLLASSSSEINIVENILINWLIDDPQLIKHQLIQSNILKYANKNPDLQIFSTLMLWYAMQEKDFSSALKQGIAIDKRFREDGHTVFEVAEIAGENMDFKTSIEAYNYILTEKGKNCPFYENAKTASLHSKFKQISNIYPPNNEDIILLDKQLDAYFKDYVLQPSNLYLFREWAQLKSLYANDIKSAKALLENAVYIQNIPPKEKAVLKLDLGDILRLDNDVWEATLLYSQVEKDFPNDTVGSLAKFKNAKLSFYLGEFDWAAAQLDVLRAATSKLIANDAMYLSMLISDNQTEDSLNPALMYFARADFYLENNLLDKAELMLDSIANVSIYNTLSEDILYEKAEIYFKRQQYRSADSLLTKLTAAFPDDLLADDALYLRATINDLYLKDKFLAMDLYQELLKKYPSSIYIVDARKRFRILRGDVLQQVN